MEQEPKLAETVSTNCGTFLIDPKLAETAPPKNEMARQSPYRAGVLFLPIWINRKCATIARKWFLPILVLVPFWQKWHTSRPIEQGCCFCQFWINRKCATIDRKRFLPILVLVPFLAEMTH